LGRILHPWYHTILKTPMNDALDDIIRITAELARQGANARKGTLVVSAEAAAALNALAQATSTTEAPATPIPDTPQPAATSPEVSANRLAALAQEVASCTKCGLCESRTQTVFADGNPSADIMFVGEAPGADEDRQGIPFVGRAGQLLTRIIEGGMKLSRDEVYICNVLKCRPPNNRDPQAAERDACFGYLREQIALVQPKVICCLGRHAGNVLLGTDLGTGRLRGSWHFFEGIPLRVTYHPSYLLHLDDEPDRLKQEKRKVWEDVQEVLKVAQGEISPQPGSAR
jgi:uracil-DNA glycosylase